MAITQEPHRPQPPAPPPIGELLHRIVDDLKLIAKDEVELAGMELEKTAKSAAADLGVVLLGGIVALIGLAFAGAAAVAGTEPLIQPLWARLLIIGGAYLGLGALVARYFAAKLSRDAVPDLKP